MIGNKLYSWDRSRTLGPMDHEHRYTTPALKPNQDISWSPAKIAAMLGNAFTAGTALTYGFTTFSLQDQQARKVHQSMHKFL